MQRCQQTYATTSSPLFVLGQLLRELPKQLPAILNTKTPPVIAVISCHRIHLLATGPRILAGYTHLLCKLPPLCIAGCSCHAVLQQPQLLQLLIETLPPLSQHGVDKGGCDKHGCSTKADQGTQGVTERYRRLSARKRLKLLLLLPADQATALLVVEAVDCCITGCCRTCSHPSCRSMWGVEPESSASASWDMFCMCNGDATHSLQQPNPH